MDIETEVSFSEDASPDVAMKTDCVTVWNKDCEMKIKQEGSISEHGTEWGYFSEDAIVEIPHQHKDCEIETNKQHLQVSSEDHVMKADLEIGTTMEIKEELLCLEEVPCFAVNENVMDKRPPSAEAIWLYTGENSVAKPVLFSDEDLGENTEYTTREDSSECEAARKYKSKESNIPEVSSVVEKVYTEQYQFHSANKPNKCDACGKSFTDSSNLRRQELFHNANKANKCGICGKSFSDPSNLRRHELIHSGIRRHKCDLCGNSFTQLTDLKNHKLIHEGKKPHECETCGKRFTLLSAMKNHKLIHGSERPHKCDICKKGFTQLSVLKKHILIHVDIKPYKCDLCGNGFTQLGHLKRHKLTHEGVKAHKCCVCNKGFSDLTCLRRHQLMHQDKRPHVCDTCGKGFTLLSRLKTHKLIHERTK